MLRISSGRARGPLALVRQLTVAATCCWALAQGQTSNTTIYWRANHAVTVVGDYLYIVGGTFTSPDAVVTTDNGGWEPENRTMALSLAESWETANAPLTLADNGGISPVAQPSLWPQSDKDEMLAWGGSWPLGWKGPSDAKLLTFKRDPKRGGAGSWSSNPAGKSSSGDVIFRGGAGSYTSCNGLGFYMGGFVAGTTDVRWGPGDASLRGLIIYDMATGLWTNNTANGFGFPGANEGRHIDGAAVCLPTLGSGGKGLVVFLGGRQGTIAGHQINSRDLEMNRIGFYDIGTKKFYSQSTTGETPSKRGHFCAVAAKSGDTNAYEIFVYGGRGVDPADVRVLTVPGFTWFSGPSPNAAAQTDRVDHACAIIGKGGRQMLAHGGVSSLRSGSLQRDTADLWANNMKVLDMTELSWGDGYNGTAPAYQQPAVVQDWYKNGGIPSVRWDTEETRALFSDAFKDTTPTPSNTSSPGGAANPPADARASPGAIAGGVIGGLAGLAAVAASLYFLWYRKRRQGQQAAGSPEAGSAGARRDGPGSPGSLDSETPVVGMAKELAPWGAHEVVGSPTSKFDGACSTSYELHSPMSHQTYEVDDQTSAIAQEKFCMPPELIQQMKAKGMQHMPAEMFQLPAEMYHDNKPQEMYAEPRYELPTEANESQQPPAEATPRQSEQPPAEAKSGQSEQPPAGTKTGQCGDK